MAANLCQDRIDSSMKQPRHGYGSHKFSVKNNRVSQNSAIFFLSTLVQKT